MALLGSVRQRFNTYARREPTKSGTEVNRVLEQARTNTFEMSGFFLAVGRLNEVGGEQMTGYRANLA